MRFNCPHCSSSARIRNSKTINALKRELFLQCTNEMCGFTFHGEFSVDRSISPSACSNKVIEKLLTQTDRSKRKYQTGDMSAHGETTVEILIDALKMFPMDAPVHMLVGTKNNPQIFRVGKVVEWFTPASGFCVAIEKLR